MVFSVLNKRVSFNKKETREYEDECFEDEEETDASTHFLRIRENELIDLMQHLERYTNALPVFGFNSVRYDMNLSESYLNPFLFNEKKIEPSVIKKANDLVSFKFARHSASGHYEVFWMSYYFRVPSKTYQARWD